MSELNTLARQLHHAKTAEGEAKKNRIAIEERIASLVAIPEGKQSTTVDVGDGMKLNVKSGGMNYKPDIEAIRNLDLEELPIKHISKWEFDKAAYEKMRRDSAVEAAQIEKYVTATPAKSSVTIKLG